MRKRRRSLRKKLVYFRLALIVVLLILMASYMRKSFARYRTVATTQADVDLAYYFVKAGDVSQDLKMDRILPRQTNYVYNFSVSNYDGSARTETALDYTIEIKTTTNLPLNFYVYKQGETTNRIISSEPVADDDGTYFKYFVATGDSFGFTEDETDYYRIEVEFPEEYNSSQYEGIVEYLKLTIYSTQKVD